MSERPLPPAQPPFDDGPDDDALDAALLSELRQAWSELPTPDATPELEDSDPLTRAAVAWMRGAYHAQQAPEPVVTLPLRVRWQRGWRRVRRQAVAALLLVGLGLAVSQGPWRHADDPRTDGPLAQGGPTGARPPVTADDGHTAIDGTGPGEAPRVPGPDAPDGRLAATDSTSPAPDAASHPDDDATDGVPSEPARPRLVAVADDHVAFRSGSVRLVLVTDPASAD